LNKKEFYIVDVFAEAKYQGNQLAVFLNGLNYSDEEMQALALEMNYSETTFICANDENDNSYDVRIFTPNSEVPFAGHPTLGTAYIIKEILVKKSIASIILNLKVGKIKVDFNPDGALFMKQIEPVFGSIMNPSDFADFLGLSINDIDNNFPIEEVSTGLPFFIIPLNTLDTVKKAKVNIDKFFHFIKNTEAKAILIFCPETYENNDLNARVFVDYYGIPEDPATGSANGCLAGYLIKNNYFNKSKINIKVEQGYEINRPSILYLKAEKNNDNIDIYVGGKVKLIAKGELL